MKATESLTDEEQEQIANFSRETYEEYLNEYTDLHRTVSETNTRRVFADSHGYELNEWSNALGINRDKILAWMHEHDGSDHDWSQDDPVVLLKQ